MGFNKYFDCIVFSTTKHHAWICGEIARAKRLRRRGSFYVIQCERDLARRFEAQLVHTIPIVCRSYSSTGYRRSDTKRRLRTSIFTGNLTLCFYLFFLWRMEELFLELADRRVIVTVAHDSVHAASDVPATDVADDGPVSCRESSRMLLEPIVIFDSCLDATIGR